MKRVRTFRDLGLLLLCAAAMAVFALSAEAAYYNEGNSGDSEATAYIIRTVSDLKEMRDRVNARTEIGKYYKLGNNIDLSEESSWESIDLMGNFDGNGKTISYGTKAAPLFSQVISYNYSNTCYIKNLNVSGTLKISSTLATKDHWMKAGEIGGIVNAVMMGNVEDCTFTGTIEVTFDGDNASNYIGLSVGGIAGMYSTGTIKNCKFSGTLHAKIVGSQSVAYAGGIVGLLYDGTTASNVENCSILSGSTISASGADIYSAAGGIIGWTSNYSDYKTSHITGCTSYADILDATYKGGIIGSWSEDSIAKISGNHYTGAEHGIGVYWGDGSPSDYGCERIGGGGEAPTPDNGGKEEPETPKTITGSLNITALERSRASDSLYFESERSFANDALICGVSEKYYTDYMGVVVNEKYIAEIDASQYSKLGLTADGNTRLILRVQTDRAGTVKFELPQELTDIGARLEDLNRDESAPTAGIATTPLNNGVYQASAVLIAPTDYPATKRIAWEVSILKVSFTGTDGSTASNTLPLTIFPTPVVLVHGFTSTVDDSFGSRGMPKAVRRKIQEAGIETFPCNYDGLKGPSDVIPKTSKESYSSTIVFRYVAKALRSFAEKGIACTRVDMVVHSMGGLMARRFVQEDQGNKNTIRAYKQGMVRRIITIATPHKGSPWANYLGGDYETLGFDNWSKGDEAEVVRLLKKHHASLCSDIKYKKGNVDSAVRDLSLNSTLVQSLTPPTIPVHVIYGEIKDNLEEIRIWAQTTYRENRDIAKNKWWPYHGGVLRAAPKILESESLFAALHTVIFGEDNSDLAVGKSSAIADFTDHSDGYSGADYNHLSICDQEKVGDRVVELLQGTASSFSTPNSAMANVTRVAMPVSLTEDDENLDDDEHFIEYLTLTATTNSVTTPGTVTYTGTADTPFENNVYMRLQDRGSDRLFKVSEAGKTTFTTTLEFTSADTGIMDVSCFTQSSGDQVYISNTEQLVLKPNLDKITKLSFESDMVITNVSSDIFSPLYATTSDGGFYDVSSPLMGTEWTVAAPSIAEVTNTGKVRGLKEGQTTLTASLNGFTATTSVDVGPAYGSLRSTSAGNSGGSGGCNAGLIGIAGLACLLALAIKRK